MEVRIPSASKLWLYELCPRSVIESKEPINRDRIRAVKDSAAYNGQMLHSCLQVFINYRINLKKSFQQSYDEATQFAIGSGMYMQWMAVDKATIELMAKDAVQVMTQIPLLMDYNGNVRRAKYHEATNDDIVVGTADCIVVRNDNSFVIADWKTGLDDVDPPESNHQLLGLAYMAQRFFQFQSFYLCVNNPILKSHEIAGPFATAQFDRRSFANVDKTKESAGDHCRYCALRGNCTSFSKMMEKECKDVGFFDTKHD